MSYVAVGGYDPVTRAESLTSQYTYMLPIATITETCTISQWKIYTTEAGAIKLKVFRVSGSNYLLIATDAQTAVVGLNTFNCSIDVEVGDIVGFYTSVSNLEVCYLAGVQDKYKAGEVTGTTTIASWSSENLGTISLQVLKLVAVTAKTSSDTGSGADAKKTGNPLATYARSETGSGVEAMPARGITLPDVGSGVEAIIGRLITLAQAGSGIEASTVYTGIKTSSDVGSGTDALSTLLATLLKSDNGSGSDTILGLLDRVFTEYGYGVEASKFGDRPVLASEVGSGIESSLLRILGEPKYSSDVGGGVDASTLASLLARSDSGVATEAIILLTAIVASDTGQGVDEVLSYLRKLVDSGEGSEIVQLIGTVGRDMKLNLYAKKHHNLIVYTEEK